MTNDTITFRQAYGVLQRHAETLRNQTEPNIDDLLSIVEESVIAFRVCKERIDAVEKALETALNDVADAEPLTGSGEGVKRGAAPARIPVASFATAPAVKTGFDDPDADIPF